MIAERRPAVAGAFLVLFPVGAELVRLERANREADLPLRRRELDDLHLIRLADGQLDLVLVAVVELGDVNEPFDAFVELDERAEVSHADDLALDRAADL